MSLVRCHDRSRWDANGRELEPKARTLSRISSGLQFALAVEKRLNKISSERWFAKGEVLGEIWGYIKIRENDITRLRGYTERKIKEIFSFSKNGCSSRGIEVAEGIDPATTIRLASYEEVLLMLSKNTDQTLKQVIADRLSGKIKQTTHQQDLVDEHERIETRRRHNYIVLGAYKRLLVEYTKTKFYSLFKGRYGYVDDTVAVIKIDGIPYHFLLKQVWHIELIEDFIYVDVPDGEVYDCQRASY